MTDSESGGGAALLAAPGFPADDTPPPAAGPEIGEAATATSPALPASQEPPPSDPIGESVQGSGAATRGHAQSDAFADPIGEAAGEHSPATPAICRAPPSDPLGESVQIAPATRGLSRGDAFADPVIAELRDAQRKRRLCIAQQSRQDRATESYLVGVMGGGRLPAGERKTMYSRAAAMMDAVALDAHNSAKAAAAIAALSPAERECMSREYAVLALNEQSRSQWDSMRKTIEKRMRELARTLPAWPFVEITRGASDLTLAVIVAECGDPTAYADKHRLFKRLGIGVVDGVRQGNPGTNASADTWTRHGYNKSRRAEVWAFLSDTLMRSQWQPNAGNIGPYGEIYARRKSELLLRYAGEKTVKGHADKAARRYASQAFIRDVRTAWRVARPLSPVMPARGSTPPTPAAAADEPIQDAAE